MFSPLPRQQLAVRWRSYRRTPCFRLPRHWRSWLLDSGSLTARLKALSNGDFRVEVVSQGWGYPNLSEARALQIDPRLRVLIREVRLIGCGQPWVHARSLIPATTLTGRHRKLAHLGTRPLGEVLFKDLSMRRGAIETARLPLVADVDLNHLSASASAVVQAWGRRSVFRLDDKPLLVSEIFLPQLPAKSPS
ncbi:MAG: chorismate lyase [Motiliproteus sp.]